MSKDLKFSSEAHEKILKGVEKLSNAVKATLGPRGRNVLYESPNPANPPSSTKDGVTVAKKIILEDPFENMGAQIVKEAASKTNDQAGDGPQLKTAKIATPNGFTTMGELKVGDKICGTNNTIQEVVGVYPKGEKEIYKVIFADGREVECCKDHLWEVTNSKGKREVLTVRDIAKKNSEAFYTPITSVEFSKNELSLNPYLLGTDKELEFIPNEYLFSSLEDREALMQGLIDSNGELDKKGFFEIKTFSSKLKEDILLLTRSLGFTIHSYQCYNDTEDKDPNPQPYRIQQLKNPKYGNKIKEIIATGKYGDMQCIKVSNSDNLYITDDFVVTHNTTTSTVLAEAIIKEGYKNVTAGSNPVLLKRGIDKAVNLVVEEIKRISKPVSDGKDIENIATISANNDPEIGRIIADAMEKVGNDGAITVQNAKDMNTVIDVTDGIKFDRGYLSPYFCTNQEKLICEFEGAFVLVYDGTINNPKELMGILEKVEPTHNNLLIIANSLSADVTGMLALNTMRGVLKICAVQSPGFGDNLKESLKDIAALTNAAYLSNDLFIRDSEDPKPLLETITLDDLGEVEKAIVSNKETTIVGGKVNKKLVEERCAQIKEQLKTVKSDFDREHLQERLGKMAGGIAVIKVGAITDVEMREKKDRVQDALSATRAAIEEGIVSGGGTSLIEARKVLKDITFNTEEENLGKEIVYKALTAPLKAISENAGINGDVILDGTIRAKKGIGYNALTGKWVNMIKTGIIDPALVERVALLNAASVAGTLLTTEVMIVEKRPPEGSIPAMPPQMMG